MLIGDYEVVVEAVDGTVLGEHTLTANTGHPTVGNEVDLGDGAIYVVQRVKHVVEPDGLSSRTYSYARVFVAPKAAAGSAPPPSRGGDSPSVPPFSGPTGRPWGPGLTSAILPEGLVAVLVACGYRAMATDFKSRKRVTSRLVRDGYGWFVERQSPEELWQLSRLAKQRCGEVQALIQDMVLGGVVTKAIDPSPCSETFQPPSPRLPSARPVLRLVSAEAAP